MPGRAGPLSRAGACQGAGGETVGAFGINAVVSRAYAPRAGTWVAVATVRGPHAVLRARARGPLAPRARCCSDEVVLDPPRSWPTGRRRSRAPSSAISKPPTILALAKRYRPGAQVADKKLIA